MGWCTLQWQTYSKMICISIIRFNLFELSHCDRFITWLVILRLPIYTIWYRRRRWSLCVASQFCIESWNGPFPRPRPWWVAPRISRSATFHVDFWSCSYSYNFICFLVVHVHKNCLDCVWRIQACRYIRLRQHQRNRNWIVYEGN